MPSKPGYYTKDFEKRLAQYDPLLRLSWGYQEGYWRVEREIRWGPRPSPGLARNYDEREMMKDGYSIALKFRPDEMDERVFYTLWYSDSHRFKNFLGRLEADEAREQKLSRQRWSEQNEYMARDRWTSWNSSYRSGPIGRYGGIEV